jgi:hypothetical protein
MPATRSRAPVLVAAGALPPSRARSASPATRRRAPAAAPPTAPAAVPAAAPAVAPVIASIPPRTPAIAPGVSFAATSAAVSTAPRIWSIDPFTSHINPGSRQGQSIFLEKTKSLDKKYRIRQEDSAEFLLELRSREHTLGTIVTHIPTQRDAHGVGTIFKNLLTNHRNISLDDCTRNAISFYDVRLLESQKTPEVLLMRTLDPENHAVDEAHFYLRVDSNIIFTFLKNNLQKSDYLMLMRKKEQFQFFNPTTGEIAYDGVTMLKIILDTMRPGTVIGLDNIKATLESVTLQKYGNNVTKLLNFMEAQYQEILDNEKDFDSWRRHILRALMSGPNADFNTWIKHIKDDIESEEGIYSEIAPANLIRMSKKKFVNMSEAGVWTKVDPGNAIQISLATQMKLLQAKIDELSTKKTATQEPKAFATGGYSGNPAPPPSECIEGTKVLKIRVVKTKDEITINGKPHYWCPKHVDKEGRWNGMYCTHRPEEHDKIKEYFQKRRAGTPTAIPTAAPTSASNSTTPDALQLASNLKQVLATNMFLPPDQVQQMIDQATKMSN